MTAASGGAQTPAAAADADGYAEGSAAAHAAIADRALTDFLRERFKGTRPIAQGRQLQELLMTNGIYVGVLGTEKQREASLTGLRQAAGFLRRALGQSLRLRYTPELVFTYDEGLEASDRVAKLLAEISRPATPGSSEDDDE